jgi:hexosaminidase
MGAGQLPITPSFSIALQGYHESRLDRAIERFQKQIALQTGLVLGTQHGDANSATLLIRCNHASKAIQDIDEDESYQLEVTADKATLSAASPLGILHGLATFSQLITVTSNGFIVPALKISDTPRFAWRGLMIDVARHFIPLSILERNLDGMAAVKMNVFHWHLSDDQGFRVESKKFSKLQEMGSDGSFYTQDEVKGLIAYARDRGIMVVPEFDVPGHATSWFVGYPQLASAPGPYQTERRWGIFDAALDPTRKGTYAFLDEFAAEMSKLFPSPYFHMGGDEVNGKQWDANAEIQTFMKAHGISSNHELQSYFVTQMQEIVAKHHKIMIGWDEILNPSLPPAVIVQSWRGQSSLADIANAGHRALLSQGYYLDLMHHASEHYSVDPITEATAALSPEKQKLILGGEACMWSEYVNAENIDSRLWPRTAVIAERFWSSQDTRDAASMYRRMGHVSGELELLGLTHRTSSDIMLRRLAGQEDVTALRVLAQVLEPVKEYQREELAQRPEETLTSTAPLNRLVDSISPESRLSRQFAEMVDKYIASGLQDASTEKYIRSELNVWAANDARLQPLLMSSFILKNDAILSSDLSASATLGLQALDYADSNKVPSSEWVDQGVHTLEEANKPKDQMLLMVVQPIENLMQAISKKNASH